ncbi:MAG: zf-HC2 domain-containing protein [Actinomycetota bacterium]
MAVEGADVTCEQLVRLVTDHLEGSLSPGVAALVDGHLDDCAACREYLTQMRLTVDALRALPAEAVTHDACMRLLVLFRGAGHGGAAV